MEKGTWISDLYMNLELLYISCSAHPSIPHLTILFTEVLVVITFAS